MATNICKCGDEFENKQQLRIHIALLTPRWPAQRCTNDHYNPLDINDVRYVNVLGYRKLKGE